MIYTATKTNASIAKIFVLIGLAVKIGNVGVIDLSKLKREARYPSICTKREGVAWPNATSNTYIS